jgi:glucose dehydrogenase
LTQAFTPIQLSDLGERDLTKPFYVPTNHVCMDYEPYKVSYTAGQYVGATVSMYPAHS